MLAGAPSSADPLAVLNGANALALAAPDGGWEVLQYEEAELEGPGRWRLRGLYRGVGGTEPLIGDPTPAGTVFVGLDRGLIPIDFGETQVGLERSYRIGPASADIGAPSFAQAFWTYEGASLRPHAPVRVSLTPEGGDLRVRWIRRSRREADLWIAPETPLAEERERYRVRVRDADGAVVREAETSAPEWLYPAAQRTADGTDAGAVTVEVAQISAVVGAGPYGKGTFDG